MRPPVWPSPDSPNKCAEHGKVFEEAFFRGQSTGVRTDVDSGRTDARQRNDSFGFLGADAGSQRHNVRSPGESATGLESLLGPENGRKTATAQSAYRDRRRPSVETRRSLSNVNYYSSQRQLEFPLPHVFLTLGSFVGQELPSCSWFLLEGAEN